MSHVSSLFPWHHVGAVPALPLSDDSSLCRFGNSAEYSVFPGINSALRLYSFDLRNAWGVMDKCKTPYRKTLG